MSQSAHLLLIEHQAVEIWPFLGLAPEGSATVMQQQGESSARVLRRTLRAAQELLDSDYRITDAFLVLASQSAGRVDSGLRLAQGLLSVLEQPAGTLHLMASYVAESSRELEVAEQLMSARVPCAVEIHFRPKFHAHLARQVIQNDSTRVSAGC